MLFFHTHGISSRKKAMESISDEKVAACAMNRIFGFEPRLGLSLIEYSGSALGVFSVEKETIREVMGPYWKYISQLNDESLEQARNELERVYGDGGEFIGWTEDTYPSMLKECEDPPIGIYLKSNDNIRNIFCGRPGIAIVGTRDMSEYGREWCRNLVATMAKARTRPLIISGLAYGVDITAHTAALEYGIPTVAVMATGIDTVYPHRHSFIADKIIGTPGSGLVTDYPAGTAPVAIHFIRRNRIIAGLSSSIIVVESKLKGGALITASLGNSYNRDIYALPGRIDDIRSQGCNQLIRDKIAEPVSDLEELTEKLGIGKTRPLRKKDSRTIIKDVYGELPQDQFQDMLAVTEAIRKNRGINAAEIKNITGLQYGTVAGIIEILASEGIIGTDLTGQCSFTWGKC